MSEVKEALDILKTQHGQFNELKKTVDDLKSGMLTDEKLVDIRDKQNRIEEAQKKSDKDMEAILKRIESDKIKTKAASMLDGDVQKRKEFNDFRKGLLDIATDKISHFNTAEQKSFIERKDYNSGADALGGATVIPFLDGMIDKLMREFSPIRSMASVVNISTDKYEQIKMNQTNGALWEKDMVNFTGQTKNNTFSKLNITVQNLHSIAVFSDDLINDSAFDIVGEILTSIAEDYALAEGISFWSGDGVGEMSGILNAPDTTDSFDGIERIVTAGSTAITLDDIFDLIGALKMPYENNAQFKAHRLTITLLRKLRSDSGAGAGTGDYLWQPSNIVGVPATLAGFPISQAPELSSTPESANAEAVVFGDFRKGYKIIDRIGATILRDNLTQYPSIAYKVKKRLSGAVSKGEAIKILKTKA